MVRNTTTRRRLLKASGAAALVGLAGCSGDGGDGGGGTTTAGDGGGATKTTTQAQTEPYRIGILQPQSGPVAKTGVAATEAYQLTARQVNERGGLAGREIETFVEDTEASPETGVQRARKLTQQDDVEYSSGVPAAPSPRQ